MKLWFYLSCRYLFIFCLYYLKTTHRVHHCYFVESHFLCPLLSTTIISFAEFKIMLLLLLVSYWWHINVECVCVWCWCLGCHSLLQPRWLQSPPSTAEVSAACLDSRRGDGGRREDYHANRSETWDWLCKPVENSHQYLSALI